MKAKTLLVLCALLSACAQVAPKAPTETRTLATPAKPAAPATAAPAATPAPAETRGEEFLLAENKLGWRYTVELATIHVLADNRVSGEVKSYEHDKSTAATFTAACGKNGGAYQWGDKRGFWVYKGDMVGDLIGFGLCEARRALVERDN